MVCYTIKGHRGGLEQVNKGLNVFMKRPKVFTIKTRNDERFVYEQWTMNNERWTMNDEQWTMNDERWTTDNGL